MQKLPSVVGLKVCQQAIVQEETRNVTLVNCFRDLSFRSFPAASRSFVACAVLTDGKGDGYLFLAISELDDLHDIWNESWEISMTDELKELWYVLPVSGCVFPRPGRFQVSLSIDGEWLAQTVVRVRQKGE